MRGASGAKLHVRGVLQGFVTGGKNRMKSKMYVLDGLHQSLLGRPEIENLNILSLETTGRGQTKTPSNESKSPDFKMEYAEVFEGLGRMNISPV